MGTGRHSQVRGRHGCGGRTGVGCAFLWQLQGGRRYRWRERLKSVADRYHRWGSASLRSSGQGIAGLFCPVLDANARLQVCHVFFKSIVTF
eukprot:2301696-Heterocapsa_arctica.AAC.1